MVNSSIAAIIAAICAASGVAIGTTATVLYNHYIDARKRRREERDVVGRYRDALLYASEELQTPLIYLCEGRVPDKPAGDNKPDSLAENAQNSYQYYHLIYLIARLFCWTYIIQNDIRNVHYSPTRQDHTIMNILYDITLTLADDKTVAVEDKTDAVGDKTKLKSPPQAVTGSNDNKIGAADDKPGAADKKADEKRVTVDGKKVTINDETKRKPPFQVFKGFQAAIGEKMTLTNNGLNNCIGYAEFWSRWTLSKPSETEVPFTVWFSQVEDGIRHLKENNGQPVLWRTDRIKKLQHHLCNLSEELDPDRLRIHRHRRIRWEPGQQEVDDGASFASRFRGSIKLRKRTMSNSSYSPTYDLEQQLHRPNFLRRISSQDRPNLLRRGSSQDRPLRLSPDWKPDDNRGNRTFNDGAGPSNTKGKAPERLTHREGNVDIDKD